MRKFIRGHQTSEELIRFAVMECYGEGAWYSLPKIQRTKLASLIDGKDFVDEFDISGLLKKSEAAA